MEGDILCLMLYKFLPFGMKIRFFELKLSKIYNLTNHSHLIKMPFAAKILDETIDFWFAMMYNVSNKSAVCGENIRWRLLWR